MTTGQDGREQPRPVRHARRGPGPRGAVIAGCGVATVALAAVLGGVVPGLRPTQQLGVDVAGGPLGLAAGLREADESSRSVDRGAAAPATQDPAAAMATAGELPTWRGPLASTAPAGTAPVKAGPPAAGDPDAPAPATSATVAPTVAPTVADGPSAPTELPTVTTAPSAAPAILGELEQRLVDATNAERAAVGCPAVTVDPRLSASADAHAVDMVAQQYFDHTGRDGSTPTSRGAAAAYPGGVAENIATGFADADAVMVAWLASADHKANIDDCSFVAVGVGFDPGALPGYGGGTWVQTFGSV